MLLLTSPSETPYKVEKHKTENLIFDSIIHTKKDPYQSKPKRVFPHSDDPYFKSSK